MPINNAKAKSLSVSPPKIISERIGSNVMNVVASDRGIVSQSEMLTICRYEPRFINGTFSRMRSKMMIVS